MAEAFDATAPVADSAALAAVGHRVVHGGDRFAHPAVIDDAVLAAIRDCVPLAPLHNPANLTGHRGGACRRSRTAPRWRCSTPRSTRPCPESSYRYAIDRAVADAHRVRRYGFHGTSHALRGPASGRVPGHPASAVANDHVAPGQRGVRVRGRRWPQHRHLHGPDPAGRTGHGHPLRRRGSGSAAAPAARRAVRR